MQDKFESETRRRVSEQSLKDVAAPNSRIFDSAEGFVTPLSNLELNAATGALERALGALRHGTSLLSNVGQANEAAQSAMKVFDQNRRSIDAMNASSRAIDAMNASSRNLQRVTRSVNTGHQPVRVSKTMDGLRSVRVRDDDSSKS